jgi:hypothetical protein
MAANEKIIQLRRLLEERHGAAAVAGLSRLETGLEALDRLDLPNGGVTEIVSDPRQPGGALLLSGLLQAAAGKHRLALIDGRDAFDPSTIPTGLRLLWVRCQDALQAAKAADLIARDGNISLAVLLLTLNPSGELRRIHANIWHRLQTLTEKSGAALLAFTPSPQIGNAKVRLSVAGHFPLGAVEIARAELEPRLSLVVERRRISTGGGDVLRRAASA